MILFTKLRCFAAAAAGAELEAGPLLLLKEPPSARDTMATLLPALKLRRQSAISTEAGDTVIAADQTPVVPPRTEECPETGASPIQTASGPPCSNLQTLRPRRRAPPAEPQPVARLFTGSNVNH